jgi:hypothetical protein
LISRSAAPLVLLMCELVPLLIEIGLSVIVPFSSRAGTSLLLSIIRDLIIVLLLIIVSVV